MIPLSKRRKLIGGVLGVVCAAWTIDMLTGGPGPSPASAASSPTVAAETVAPPTDPADLESVIESLRSDPPPRPALPFDQVTRDLFVPTPWMATTLADAGPASSASSEAPGEPVAEPLPFEARHELQGIMTGHVPLALIDGLLCRRGVEIDGYRLVELHRGFVVFQQGESRVTLQVASPGHSE